MFFASKEDQVIRTLVLALAAGMSILGAEQLSEWLDGGCKNHKLYEHGVSMVKAGEELEKLGAALHCVTLFPS